MFSRSWSPLRIHAAKLDSGLIHRPRSEPENFTHLNRTIRRAALRVHFNEEVQVAVRTGVTASVAPTGECVSGETVRPP
ncbi:MAG: hypothetical protein K0S45_540 [Nitrospira sp.]|jgi:hypothetical protein|nr:hypothetical protein [Nitrospira sp.]